jgi:hypothetical protein
MSKRRRPHLLGRTDDQVCNGSFGGELHSHLGGGKATMPEFNGNGNEQGEPMTSTLFMVGAGAFGHEVFSMIEAHKSSGGVASPAGFIDDGPSATDFEGVDGLGTRVVAAVGNASSC